MSTLGKHVSQANNLKVESNNQCLFVSLDVRS